MNVFEYLKELLDEELRKVFEVLPELSLDLNKEEWDEYYE